MFSFRTGLKAVFLSSLGGALEFYDFIIFGTFAGYGKLDPDISFKKLRAMVEGAEIASRRLWPRA